MSENDSESPGEAPLFARPRAFDTILYGGLVVGILDMLFAFTFYGLILGAQPLRIFQSVTAGLLGRTAAYEGGNPDFPTRYSASLYCGDLHRHSLLPGKLDLAGVDSSPLRQRIDL